MSTTPAEQGLGSVAHGDTTSGTVGNLPSELDSFVGRAELLDQCERLLVERTTASRRVVALATLVGPGGFGKTRLALKLAERVSVRRSEYPDGVWLVELAEVDDEVSLYSEVMAALRIPDNTTGSSGSTGLAKVIEEIHDKRMLVVLDNCEHLLEAGLRELVVSVLQAAPGVQVLATSREPLGLAGEEHVIVPALSVVVDDEHSSSEQEAVALLRDRAASVRYSIGAGERPLAVELCRLVEGSPLAIELAAANLRYLTLSELVAELRGDDEDQDVVREVRGRFTLLQSGQSTNRRHRTLPEMIEWSYRLCTADEQRLWAQLCVFRGGFDRAAAEKVCVGQGVEAEQVLGLLIGLTKKSIVIAHQTVDGTRYRMPESVREFGLLTLDADCYRALRQAHAEEFFRRVDEAAREWFSRREVSYLRGLHREVKNNRLALAHWRDTPGQQVTAVRMARLAASTRWHVYSGHHGENARWLELAMASHPPEPTGELMEALALGSWGALIQGDPATGLALLARCREVTEALGCAEAPAVVLYAEGTALWLTEPDPARAAGAIAILTQALERSRREDYSGVSAMIALFRAMATVFYGTAREAELAVEDVLSAARGRQAPWAMSWAMWVSGLYELLHTKDLERAHRCAQEALAEQHTMGEMWGKAWSEWLLWLIASAMGDHARAARLCGGAVRLLDRNRAELSALLPFAAVHARAEARSRKALGEDEFTRQRDLGQQQSCEDMMEFALEPSAREETTTEPSAVARAKLSPREIEIIALVAQGMTNKQIGATLFISGKTVGNYVSLANRKLGFATRTQLGVWWREQPESSDHDRRAG